MTQAASPRRRAPFTWGYIPPAPVEPAQQKALLEAERQALPTLIKEQGGVCAACGFPAGRALRGYRAPDEDNPPWQGVCPLCLAALDWSRAPDGAQLIYLPEWPHERLNLHLHTLFSVMYGPDADLQDTADLAFEELQLRGQHMQTLFAHFEASPALVCQAYWALSEDQMAGAKRLLEKARVLISPERLGAALEYWRAHRYPQWRAGRER